MKLFDDIPRTDMEAASYGEPHFNYLNRSGRRASKRIREILESWFVKYPHSAAVELRGRFRSPDNVQHLSAFFELLLNELLLRLGCKVEVHPALTGKDTHPDFLAQTEDGHCFYLEATLATGESEEERKMKARQNAVYDALNRLDSPNFFIGVDVLKATGTQPSASRIRAFLNKELSKLDPDEVAKRFKSRGLKALPHWPYEQEGWSIEFFPIPKPGKLRGKSGVRPIGILMEGAKWLDTRTPIREAILDKVGTYGSLRLPYVVAVNALGDHVDRTDIMEALFGRETYEFRQTAKGISGPKLKRKPDGVWGNPAKPTSTRVSAVLIVVGLYPWTIGSAVACLYHNPWATKPYDCVLNQLPRAEPRSDGEIAWVEGRTLSEIFELPENWLKD